MRTRLRPVDIRHSLYNKDHLQHRDPGAGRCEGKILDHCHCGGGGCHNRGGGLCHSHKAQGDQKEKGQRRLSFSVLRPAGKVAQIPFKTRKGRWSAIKSAKKQLSAIKSADKNRRLKPRFEFAKTAEKCTVECRFAQQKCGSRRSMFHVKHFLKHF